MDIFREKLLFLCIVKECRQPQPTIGGDARPRCDKRQNDMDMKKIVVLTGAGMSAESGLKTFRDAGGLWEEYPVQQVASHEGWEADPALVTKFYNERRRQLAAARPNEGHRLVAALENDYDVTVVTQNVDNLHEQAGSTKVIHLHGELMKVCSSRDPYDPRYIQTLTADNCEVKPGTLAADGSLLRPFIVFFGEAVPMIEPATKEAPRPTYSSSSARRSTYIPQQAWCSMSGPRRQFTS